MAKDARERVAESAAHLRALLEDVERLVRDPAARADEINRLQQRIMVLCARQTALVAQLRTGPTAPLSRPPAGGLAARSSRSMRETTLDALDLIGVPATPRSLSEIAWACFSIDLAPARFASLRRDEERAWQANPHARPAWVVPAISAADYLPIARLVSSSAWPLEGRLIGARTQRVNHLVALLALLRVWERADQPDVEDGESALRALVLAYARSVPGAVLPDEPPLPARIREMAQAELDQILPDDLEERGAAALRMGDWPPAIKLWGQTGPRLLVSAER